MIMKSYVTLLVSAYFCFSTFCFETQPPGHLKPLGSHQQPEGGLSSIKFISSAEFYAKYVKQRQPVVIRGLLNGSKPVNMWDDLYLERKFGDEMVNVDIVKEKTHSVEMTMREFLATYKKENAMYLISTLSQSMQDEFPLPNCLKCKGFMDRLQDFVMWFSGGNSKSNLHYDNVENLYCQIHGTKEWIVVDPVNGAKHIIMDRPDAQFCSVNVSSVDMIKYPGLQDMPWWKASIQPGDCIYMPMNWWHQVSSPEGRNMAVNIWWAPLIPSMVDRFACEDISEDIMLSQVHFTYGEWVRSMLAFFIEDQGGKVDYELMHSNVVHEHTGDALVTKKNFDELDLNLDRNIEVSELIDHPHHVIHAAVKNVPIGAMNTNGKYNFDPKDDDENYAFSKEEL